MPSAPSPSPGLKVTRAPLRRARANSLGEKLRALDATLTAAARHVACCSGRMHRTKRSVSDDASRRTALLLIDFMNPMDFDGADAMAPHAIAAAARAARLRDRMRAEGAPIIYANDNFGRWESDFAAVVLECERRGGASAAMAKALAPKRGDRSVLKPRHSAFFGTPLEFLLDELDVGHLVLTGLAADSCIMFTAHDAYLREYELWIPADCVASEQDAWRRDSLAYMARVLKARTDPVAAEG
jgi:nicotinamidase-related amidase